MKSNNIKHKRKYESRVRMDAIVIYLLAFLLCGGMIYYISNLKNSINFQRENINKNDKILKLTNELIKSVNKAQAYANLYTFSNNKTQLKNFNKQLTIISNINDSIIISSNNSINRKTLDDILLLLKRKELIIRQIARQYDAYNPYQEIYDLISNYKPVKTKPVLKSTTTQDTIIYKSKKKNFFKRIGSIFSPDKYLDSVVLVTKTVIDTIEKEQENDTINILYDIQLYTEKGRQEYTEYVKAIENQYKKFILSDQKISEEISDLLIVLHKQTLESVLNEVQKSEDMINKNLDLSIYSGIASLIIILTFIFMILYDLKKVAKARKATEEAKKKIEEIMESRHKLLLSVSHDIKAPLSSILGYFELMQMDNVKPEESHRISSMKNSVEHILSLLTNLLNFSSLDQGKEVLTYSNFSIGKLCDDLKDMFAPMAKNKQLTFIYNKKIDNNIYIKSDALKIKQILSNVLSNATKYTVKGNIRFSVYRKDNNIIFSIIDQGIGIPKDKIEEIFKPFNRIGNNKSIVEGNGFGLFVVKGLIDLLKGEIQVSSEPNKGTHFQIILPAEFVSTKEEAKPSIYIHPLKTNKKINILLIDDDNTFLTIVNLMLTKLGTKSNICRSLIEFNNYCKNLDHYDIILTDREMGTFSGNDVLKTIKKIDPDKKVILMTARSEYNENMVESEGFDGYLQKPFSIKVLSELLQDNSVENETMKTSEFNADFPELCAMFDNDNDSIRNILKIFVESTSNNLVIFNDILNRHEFKEAVNLCHKMCPMFIQLNQNETAKFLKKMDKLREKDKSTFPEWEEESLKFMNLADDFISYLADKYKIE